MYYVLCFLMMFKKKKIGLICLWLFNLFMFGFLFVIYRIVYRVVVEVKGIVMWVLLNYCYLKYLFVKIENVCEKI